MLGRAERSTVFNCQPLLTQDMTIAQVRGFDDKVDSSTANCCALHGGLKQCPGNSPKMCADSTCDNAVNNCIDRGGLKECAAENSCPWVIPQIEDNMVECNNGNITNTADFNSTEAWFGGQSRLKTCPWNL